MENNTIKYTLANYPNTDGVDKYIANRLTFTIESSPDEIPDIISALLVPLHALDEDMFSENDRFVIAKIIKGLIPTPEQYLSLIEPQKETF